MENKKKDMSIKSIFIQNFQSHQNTTLDLDKRINIIAGKTNSGKTAILRALNFVINNKSFNSCRSKWGGDTSVSINVDNSLFTRSKVKKDNIYKLNEQEFKAFGKNVPEEIEKHLNFNELNIQKQMDGPFLLSKSPGEIARYLNTIVNLDIIDSTLKNIEKDKRDTDKKVLFLREQLKNILNDTKQYKNIEELEKHINTLENLILQESTERHKYSNLTKLINSINKKTEQKIEYKSKIKYSNIIEDLFKKTEEIKKIQKKEKSLAQFTENLYNIYTDMKNIAEEIKEKKEEFNRLMPEKCPLCGK
jgi:DNA repair exonuclease SbcCD ATPase subunit